MRTFYTVLLLLCSTLAVQASPGDTTWVQARVNQQFTAYGATDSSVTFPSGTATYRKIYLIFTMGTYNCPSGSQYCHQWDYDIHNVIMTPTGDTVELSRFISPFATSGVPRFPAGWTHRYVFDVTDYAPLLKGTNFFRVFYSGYSWGFTGNVKFAFVEGTPERTVVGISKLWTGSYQYGNAANPIDNNVTAVTRTVPAGTQGASMKLLITGHGADANGCCEFASHNYKLKVNNTQVDSRAIWRADCGFNELYPQGGTWIFDRANWCPGATVVPNMHRISGLTAGSTYTTDLDFDPYTVTANYGSYNIQANMIYYGGFNKTTDASLEDILNPTDYEGYYRENPTNGKPVIRVHNAGSATITSMQIAYGVKDSVASTYNWTGSLAPLSDTTIMLPEVPALKSLSLKNNTTTTYGFTARVATVNGAADNDAKNDTLRSTFTVAPMWPNHFMVAMKTNNEGTNGIGAGLSESSWKITDASGAVVASRTGASLNTQYNDTVHLTAPGMYTLTVADGGCDGLSWWYWAAAGVNVTSGSFIIRNDSTNAILTTKGSISTGSYASDFGCGFSQAFSIKDGWVAPPTAGVATAAYANAALTASPNPATDRLNLSLAGLPTAGGTLALYDVAGRLVQQLRVTAATTAVSLQGWNDGHYTAVYTDAQTGQQLKAAFIVAH